MGIDGQLKQISIANLEVCKPDASLMGSFFDARWLPESPLWQIESVWKGESADHAKQRASEAFDMLKQENENAQEFKERFLADWESPALDLDGYWDELTFLLAGYIPGYIESEWTIPELRPEDYGQSKSLWQKLSNLFKSYEHQYFLHFLVTPNSDWDGLPLVNAFGAGTATTYRTGYEFVRYLLPNQMEEILVGLTILGEQGFQNRFQHESAQATPCPWIDWSETDMLAWLIDYYREIVAYYQDAINCQNAVLLYVW